jgi:hypothetical protein
MIRVRTEGGKFVVDAKPAGRKANPLKRTVRKRVKKAFSGFMKRGGLGGLTRKKKNPAKTMKTFELVWSPTGQKIGTVRATTAKAAKGKAPKPYSRYKGEIYAREQ